MVKKVVNKINSLLFTHDISLRELSRMTDIRHATLSELANQKRENINLKHLGRIADELSIDDLKDIIDLEERDDTPSDEDR